MNDVIARGARHHRPPASMVMAIFSVTMSLALRWALLPPSISFLQSAARSRGSLRRPEARHRTFRCLFPNRSSTRWSERRARAILGFRISPQSTTLTRRRRRLPLWHGVRSSPSTSTTSRPFGLLLAYSVIPKAARGRRLGCSGNSQRSRPPWRQHSERQPVTRCGHRNLQIRIGLPPGGCRGRPSSAQST